MSLGLGPISSLPISSLPSQTVSPAVEETASFQQLFVDDTPVLAPFGTEYFAGSLPLDEGASPAFVLLDEPVWLAPRPEDFAGSLPLDESAAPALVLPDEPPAALTTAGEEFGGAHPTEDSAPTPWSPLDEPVWLAPSPEDFASSLAIDESAAPPLVLPDDIAVALTNAGEDLVGGHVPDEYGLPIPARPSRDPAWFSVGVEEFVSSAFSLDETAVPPPITRLTLPVQLLFSLEDFAVFTSIVDEPSLMHVLPPSPARLSTFAAVEEFVGRIVPPPPPPPPPTPTGGQYRNMDWEWRAHLDEMADRRDAELGATDIVHRNMDWEWRAHLDEMAARRYAESDVTDTVANDTHLGPVEDVTPEHATEIVGKADYALMPIGDGLEVTAFADGVIRQFVHTTGNLCAVLTADNGVKYLYASMRTVFGQTGRRVRHGEPIGLSGGMPSMGNMPPSGSNAPWFGDRTPSSSSPQLAVKRPAFASWTSEDWVRHYAPSRRESLPRQPAPRPLVDSSRWLPRPQVRTPVLEPRPLLRGTFGPAPEASLSTWLSPPRPRPPSPAAFLATLSLPLMLVAPAPGVIMAIASLFALGIVGRKPVATFAFSGRNNVETLSAAAHSWLIVTLPSPATGEMYYCFGKTPPLSLDPARPVRSVSVSSYALPIGSGSGTVTFRLVLANDPSYVIRTYALRLSTF